MNKPLIIIFATIALDAVGLGLIFPILPRLIAEVTQGDAIAPTIGIMAALYAAMQFLFAPMLGALSDSLGRRPVLLVSLAGAAINYVVMAVAPQLWMLLLGRALAGLTSANVSVAMAYITDISPPEKRARRFGLFNAMFGIGFIIGPVLGGVLGDYGVRLPFIAAAVLNAGNLLLALFILPESRKGDGHRVHLGMFNPLLSLRWAFTMKSVLPVVLLFFALSATGEAYGTCWALWGGDVFHWNGLWIGLSLGLFGACQAVIQALLPSPATRLLGDRWAVLAGIACNCAALVVIAFTGLGWVVFLVMPAFALGGIGTPALQSLSTRLVAPSDQGRLQGVLASAVSLASIVAPLVFSTFYMIVRAQWPGAIWLAVVAVYGIVVPLVFLVTRTAGVGCTTVPEADSCR